MESTETPQERLARIQKEPGKAGEDDIAFLVKEIGIRQQALQIAMSGSKPGRVFGLYEAADLLTSASTRLKIRIGSTSDGLTLLKASKAIREYARALEKEVPEPIVAPAQ